MVFTVAVAGKGGVGKTSIAALLVGYYIKRNHGPVLAVDADPNSNLHEKLGMKPGRTVGELREKIANDKESLPVGVSKAEHVQYHIRTTLSEGKGFDLLTMGRPEGPGCYCYVNSLLRTFVDSLSEKYPFIVIDNEAGMEHLSRRTTRHVDMLLIISDTTPTGIQTAKRLYKLSSEMDLKIGRTVLLLNRIRIVNNTAIESSISPPIDFETVVYLPEDDELNNYNSECKSLLELPVRSKAYVAIDNIMDGLVK